MPRSGLAARGLEIGQDDNIAAAISETLTAIHSDLKGQKSKYPQLIHIDKAVITDSQLSYENGKVRCGSKARPCTFSGPDACRLIVNLTRIATRPQSNGHPGQSELVELPNGSYLEIEAGVEAPRTANGRRFSVRVNTIIMRRLNMLKTKLVTGGG